MTHFNHKQFELNSALWLAVDSNDINAAERALDQGAEINSTHGAPFWSAMGRAVERGYLELLQFLLKRGADPSLGLHLAAFSQSVNPVLQLLLAQGSNPNIEDWEGITPLFLACGRNGSYLGAKLLLDAGANPNHRSEDGDTPLMWAAYQRDWQDPENPLVALLDAGADPNMSNEEGAGSVPTTALIWAARHGHCCNVCLLLSRGADPDLKDCTGTTALLTAAAFGHVRIVEVLLAAGATRDVRDSEGATAQILAERYCAELLAYLNAP